MSNDPEKIISKFWNEIEEDHDPFTTKNYLCSGYDVFNDVLPNATFIEYFYLLFKHEKPSKEETLLLNSLSIALANPGPRSHTVQAAMSGAAGGSVSAACLMSAIAVGAGNLGGSREIFHLMNCWDEFQTDTSKWDSYILSEKKRIEKYEEPSLEKTSKKSHTAITDATDVWLPMEHITGFNPHGVSCPTPTSTLLKHLNSLGHFTSLYWLHKNQKELEKLATSPITITFVASAALADLGFDSEESEMIFMLLRLPGAAAHAIEQKRLGWQKFPFYGDKVSLLNDPGFESDK